MTVGEKLSQILARFGVLIAFIAVVAWFSLARPGTFPTVLDIKNILTTAAPTMILAAGLTVPLVMDDFDLSVTSMVSLSGGAAIALMVTHGWDWPLALLIGIALGGVVGATNGFLIAYLGGSSFIITLGMGTVLTGLEFALTGQATIFTGVPKGYTAIATSSFLGLGTEVWIAFAVAVVIWILLDATEIGRYMHAIGGNPEAARLSGINTRGVRWSAFVVVALLAAVVGILLTADSGAYTPSFGAPYLLAPYAACFLGAAVFRPGEFNLPGTFVGVLLLGVIQTGLTMLNLQSYLINLVQGGVLISAVLLSRAGQRGSG